MSSVVPSYPVRSPLRQAIAADMRRPEADCILPLIEQATLTETEQQNTFDVARHLTRTLRTQRRPGGVEALVQEFSLSSAEGVSLMCLAEALLRIPDAATRDALIRDRIGTGDWLSHIGGKKTVFVNAASWGLMLTGKLTNETDDGLAATLFRLVGRGGQPLVRRALDIAMRMMGEQFVIGETIEDARKVSAEPEERGFKYSYDMLGEAAMTEADALRYRHDYERAINVIGQTARGTNVYEKAGISIKLSALHPRYAFAQRERVLEELGQTLKDLVVQARRYDIGINIDAEESERLDLSLDLIENLCHCPELDGWNGIGIVVQAYGRRASKVLDYLIDLGRRSGHRLMIRLVKGAYWDSEIKKAQVEGQTDFPVYTRKCYTDVSYIACAKKLLAARDVVFPQFATHNARTLATIYTLAGLNFQIGDYEFQCLHGMGETLYHEVVGPQKLNRPCRVYAPVGSHETLLAYLVRRLLENGANSSFVNQIGDESLPIESLIEDPVALAKTVEPPGASHPAIALPKDLFEPERTNSHGLDLTDEHTIAALSEAVRVSAEQALQDTSCSGEAQDIRNPARHPDRIGTVRFGNEADVRKAIDFAESEMSAWATLSADERSAKLDRAADLLEQHQKDLIALLVREAGKSYANALSEVREAVDFLRYYAAQAQDIARTGSSAPLGVVACISPWNFPLAIFLGQVAAALAAGNTVVAKPAEETPFIALLAVALLRKAGVPENALRLVPGAGETGAALVADTRISGVMFTGSTAVAGLIAKTLAGRTGVDGQPVPFIAETGGQNAMIVDSSALTEQVVANVLVSAFDSAGQRCSALRVLCVQEDCADRVLTMLRGAVEELRVGNPAELHTDVGPVISAEARSGIQTYIDESRALGRPVWSLPLPESMEKGTFIAPTIIEIDSLADLKGEVFGPVLHVLRFESRGFEALLNAINQSGYGLTFGLHTRIESRMAHVTSRIEAGNLYVNRNMVGAVVGSQPFGGEKLSGTGPKAGGPLILRRLMSMTPAHADWDRQELPEPARQFLSWLMQSSFPLYQKIVEGMQHGLCGATRELPGPVGETNLYELLPRGAVLCVTSDRETMLRAVGLALSGGNTAFVQGPNVASDWVSDLPHALALHIRRTQGGRVAGCRTILASFEERQMAEQARTVLSRSGMVVQLYMLDAKSPIRPEWVLQEKVVSTNTTAAGGNASLMTIG
ncbi:bifunctional proline dehydrogenase/L-glutamate gamma-semialdehyde dehydrogenase PutA [Gluconobacter kondonii]|uniref:bifunctional proline dehydrogenase/L-glutamate gamma-semialdehyde dehydrogenase PutA n=1 Tax=Gluconobacter kondonii TaxID=941463 RepID=UPI001B8C42A9|nr:bifunctional proline dehydrogenase/L-glutamate gamma-semialdehyde dehydrogenase PutA [Gluconobacter kondonii]MBS1054578.1 bifunctional proline dehydrogenase/L-glutamate gamma-semialdehyde dehydrogenase PutA [Gluconobacter kondonii]MBS1057820.1 bifunctional proline dehydrogenase/L-glutamate gamma-semialdehyde dehydrogenase PutA [Gluconobacter kondonii]